VCAEKEELHLYLCVCVCVCVSAFYLEKKRSKGTIDSWIQFGIPTVPWLLMDRSTCDSRWESSACDVDAVHRQFMRA